MSESTDPTDPPLRKFLKLDEEKAVRRTISMSPELDACAVELQKNRKYATFSDLMQSLIRAAFKETHG